jgi:ABC-type sugar transport system substrate-binding protein
MAGVIGLFLRSSENDYQRQLKEAAEQEARRAGFSLLVESAHNDPARQVAQIKAAIAGSRGSGLVAIVVSTVSEQAPEAVVRDALAAGLEWVTLNRETAHREALHDEFRERAIFCVTPDQLQIGRTQGQQVRALMPQPSLVVCVTGPVAATATQLRLTGLRELISPGYTLVELNADWTSERARLVLKSWLDAQPDRAPLPGIVVAQNDEMALGVRQALHEAAAARDLPLFTTPILGCDGSQTFGQRLVREGRIRATVVTAPASRLAVEWLARVRVHGSIAPTEVIQDVSSFPALSALQR